MRRLCRYLLLAVALVALNLTTVALFLRSMSPSASGGAPQECAPGDLNGDTNATVADVVYLLNYMFLNGPEPTPCSAAEPSAPGWPPAPEAIVNLCGEAEIDYETGESHTVYTVPADSILVVTQCLVEGRLYCSNAAPFTTLDLALNGNHLKIGSDSFVVEAGEDLTVSIASASFGCVAYSGSMIRWFIQGYLADATTGEYPSVSATPNPKDLVTFAGREDWSSIGDSEVLYTVPEGKTLVLTNLELPGFTYPDLSIIERSEADDETMKFQQIWAGSRDTQNGYYSAPAYHFMWDRGHELPLFFESGSDVVVRRETSPYPSTISGDYLGTGYLIDAK